MISVAPSTVVLSILRGLGRFLLTPVGMAVGCLVLLFVVNHTAERRGVGIGEKAERGRWESRLREDAAKARQVEARNDVATKTTQARVEAAQTVIRTRTEYLTREVPIYVPVDPARASLPVGLVRVHDAAALGLPIAPDPSGRPDDAPSGVDDVALGQTVVGNYGQCHLWREQLMAWQDWARETGLAK